MKAIKNWLKGSYHAYCAMAAKAMDCGLFIQPNQGF